MPPDYVVQTIPYTSIKYPDSFCQKIHADPGETQLVTNLRQFGQVSPLLVWKKPRDTFQLLADYACFRALSLLGCEQAICRVLPDTIAPHQRYAVQVLHGWSELQASPILQAYLLQHAQQDLSETELLSILSLMGHKPHQHVADELIALLTLADTALLAVHRGILAVKSAKLLRRLPLIDQVSVVELVQKYRPGGSKQYKLVEMLTELALRWNTSVAVLLEKCVPTGQTQEIDNGPQQMQHLLRELSTLCWPEKMRLDRQFHQFVNSLSLPKNVSIAPSPSFEDDSLTLCLHYASDKELQKKWESIKVLLQNDERGRSDML
jgi:ParB family transcriptional regulator, chromosome partitioning protein